MPKVIVNSTPLISLIELDRLDILKVLYNEIIIPTAVYNEISVKDKFTLPKYDWIKVKEITNEVAKGAFTTALHEGEVEVLILAKEISADLVVIDDGLARKHAKYLDIKITGTIGVLLKAKEKGIIKELKPYLDRLIENSFYISDDIYNEVLELTDE